MSQITNNTNNIISVARLPGKEVVTIDVRPTSKAICAAVPLSIAVELTRRALIR